MKKILSAVLIVLGVVSLAYGGNESNCQKWCKENDRCQKCSKWVGCGKGLKNIKAFRGKGKDWFACGKTIQASASAKNKNRCEEYCKEDKQCDKCSELPACGPGYTSIATFKGPGKNWFACKKNYYGAKSGANKQECLTYCKQNNKRCKKCSEKPGCGLGYEVMATFRGSGKNWFACEKK